VLQEAEVQLAGVRKRKQAKEIDINRNRAKRAQERNANKAKLKVLRKNVRGLWKRYDISSRVCLTFMKRLFKEISDNAASPDTITRCKDELRRLVALKQIGQNIESRAVLTAKVARKKKEGLMSSTSKVELDAIATDLWQYTEMLHGKNKEVVKQIQGYQIQYKRPFTYRGRPYLTELLAEMNQRDETVQELKDNIPRFEAHLNTEHKFGTAHSRQDLDTKYLEAHQKLYSRVHLEEVEHEKAGDIGYNHEDLNIMHNTLERIGYRDD